MVKDPVCGMELNESAASAKTDYKGKTYYFCSSSCQSAFEREPEKYATKGDSGSEHHQHH